MSVKISSLEIENVKRVKAVQITPAENGLMIIGGKNNQGKTSVLDAIAWALGGDRLKPSQAVREGSVIPPHMEVTLSNGIKVVRSGNNSTLKVIDPDGNKGGQQLLNEFVEQFALDLPKFLDRSSKHVCDFITKCEKRTESRTAWRIEGTLREFPKFPPVNVWFDYPVHRIDKTDVLKDIQPDDGRAAGWQKNFSKKKTEKERKDERKESLEMAFDVCMIDGKVTLSGMAEYMGVTEKTVRNRIKEHGGFWIDDNEVGKKSK